MEKTRGIVLRFVKYAETSIIVKVYTQDFGLQSLLVNGARSKKSRFHIAFFQPLTLLDFVFYYKESSDIHRIAEVKTEIPFKSIPFDPGKSAIALFITELVSRTLHDRHEDNDLFLFLHDLIQNLDQMEEGFENVPLIFLVQYSKFLGLEIQSGSDIYQELDLHGVNAIREEEFIDTLVAAPIRSVVKAPYAVRQAVLSNLIKFYRQHFERLGEMRSLSVLHALYGH